MFDRTCFHIIVIFMFLLMLVGCTTHQHISKSFQKDTVYIEKTDTVKFVSHDTVTTTKDNFISIVDSTVIREYIDELGVKNREIERYRNQLKNMSSDRAESHDMTANEKSSSVVDSVSVSEVESVVVEQEPKPSFFKSLFQKIGNVFFFIIYTFVIVVIAVFIHKIIIINKKKNLWKY